ncbi:hypothetical protein LCI18_014077 [Fusarium solani-melongenae]|uniref:Uncharacterized protein n=1 Tax=Fusarium solani subsp. cucurbitae TaxID=2747967 RepID=A0ACD3ZPL4_FUSSC|nr:hypothetical protein LCI18_014077 [Fusarium solani-melongenae]
MIFSLASAALRISRLSRRSTLQLTFRAYQSTMASSNKSQQFFHTSGATDSVWVHQDPVSNRPSFSKLGSDIETDVCIIGAGIAGISTAYELVNRGREVVLLEARQVLSGETGRTSGHLTNDLDDRYTEIAKKHGESGAKVAAESHAWARERVGEISKALGIECEYRKLPAYEISQYTAEDAKHDDELRELREEEAMQRKLGLEVTFDDKLTVRGWNGAIDQRGGLVVHNQATFHPTKYLNDVLKWLQKQPNFRCYDQTRVISVEEKGIEILGIGNKSVNVQTTDQHTVKCNNAVETTCVPLQKLSVIAEMEYMRTYCIAIRVPRGSVEDCLLYDQAEEYKYVRLTACDDKDDYLIVGGCDHKVGQEDTTTQSQQLENWTRDRFTQAGKVDYRWSGQIFEPVDFMAFIGKNQGNDHIYIVTGDSGDGLTHGVLAGRLIADEIDGVENSWASVYSPKRLVSITKSLPSMVAHDLQINTQYKRFLQSDISDIEDLGLGMGGVLNQTGSKPMAIYKDEEGDVKKFSALCPHMKGVVCWNTTEKSFDCPVHGSRFSREGICVMGPSKGNLQPIDESAKVEQGSVAAS